MIEEDRGAMYSSTATSSCDQGRTIPFLKRLTEMLQNNSELISFIPGKRLPNNVTTKGQIVVHDRNRVQAEVLPIYFNHASFASLRRQLSYFSFQRVGKGRCAGVTYTNDDVVELSDILQLKRRVTVNKSSAAAKKTTKARAAYSPTEETQHLDQLAVAPEVASAMLSGTMAAAKTNDNLDPTAAVRSSISTAGASGTTSHSSISHSSNSSMDKCVPKTSEESLCVAKKRNKPSCKRLLKNSTPQSRKERKRLDKLLSLNRVVPFIHLPERRKDNNNEVDADPLPRREKAPGKDAAITALLALGLA